MSKASDDLARRKAEAAAARRKTEDEVLRRAGKAGASQHVREAAASIRDHRSSPRR